MAYTDEDKRRILEESRATLAELEAERAFQADSSELRSPAWIEELLGPTDPLERHRAEQEELARARARYQEREMADTNAQRTRDWERWTDARIARALAELNLNEVLGELVSEIRHELRQEFAAALAKYAAQGDATVAQLRAEIARTKAHDDGSLVDLVSPVVRKIRDSSAA